MASSGRLSNTSRDALIKSILNNRFDNDRKQLEKLHEETDQAIITHMVKDLTAQQKKDYRYYVELNWFDKSKSAKLQFRPGSFVEHQFKIYRQLPKSLNRVHIVEEPDALFKLYSVYANMKDKLEAEEKRGQDCYEASCLQLLFCEAVDRSLARGRTLCGWPGLAQ